MSDPKGIRRQVLKMITSASAGHTGPCLSTVDILYVLYFRTMQVRPNEPEWPNRDRFILSKGHAAAALYATLAERGYFPVEALERYYVDGGLLPGHLDMRAVPGIEASSGSLGHGLSLGIGMALAVRNDGYDARVFILVGDGECQEGSIWEGLMFAPRAQLDNLTLIVDHNKLQDKTRVAEITDMSTFLQHLKLFGWDVHEVDGHDLDALEMAIRAPQFGPKVILAHTIKGKGVSFMEDRVEWHALSPTKAQLLSALRELR